MIELTEEAGVQRADIDSASTHSFAESECNANSAVQESAFVVYAACVVMDVIGVPGRALRSKKQSKGSGDRSGSEASSRRRQMFSSQRVKLRKVCQPTSNLFCMIDDAKTLFKDGDPARFVASGALCS